jgi:hypothetical protein
MANSMVHICNKALAIIGDDRINSINEDSKRARLLKEIFACNRDSVLRLVPWNFAKVRTVLSPDSAAPAWGFTYQFTLPADCLRVLRLDYDEYLYRVEGRKILSDLSTINVLYISAVEDTEQFDSLFSDALAGSLAMDIAYPLTSNPAMVKVATNLYFQALAEASRINGMESRPEAIVSDTFTNVR